MRGRPLMEWLLFAAVWALLLIPLRQVTGRGGRERVERLDRAVDAVLAPVWLRVAFSEPPEVFTLYSGGQTIWGEAVVSVEREHLADIVMGPGGPELEMEAQWAGAGRRAVEIAVEPVEGRAWHAVIWGEGARMREKVIFQ